ncbi:MAG: hypothetical protein JWP38_3728 [Herbaspirillum sp.]|nr:hypothetical protein [Herbaspirillum sp.]
MSLLTTNFDSGTIDASTVAIVPAAIHGCQMPLTATLKSAAGGRAIQLSTDGGVEYFTPTVDTTSATMLIVIIGAPVSHIKFTGAAGDTWSVR